MDPKLLYWTGALANLALVVACGALGVRAIRRGDVRRHRVRMLAAAALVALFLLSYVAKVAVLGREDRSHWTALDHATLYVHELCIAVMLGAGLVALAQVWRFRRHVGPVRPPEHVALPGRVPHRRGGWTAAVAGALAAITAVAVWVGMIARSL